MRTRRDMAAFTCGALVAKLGLPMVAKANETGAPAGAPHPDAVLIEACRRYPIVSAAPGAHEMDGSPEDQAHTEVTDAIDANPPQTWEGLVAKLHAATCTKTTWNELRGWGGYEEQWAGEIAEDLLRLIKAGVVGVGA